MALTIEVIKAFAAKAANNVITDQINLNAPGAMALASENVAGMSRALNVRAGGNASGGAVKDYDTYADYDSTGGQQILVLGVDHYARCRIGIREAETVTGRAGAIDLLEKEFKSAGAVCAFVLGRSVFNAKLGAVEANATISGTGTATVSVNDISAFRVGLAFDRYDSTAVTKKGSAVVTSVVRDGDGTGSIVLASCKNASDVAETSGTIAITDTLWIKGHLAYASNERFVGLEDLAGTGDVYGTTVSASDWAGSTTTVSGSLLYDHIREKQSDVRDSSGLSADMCLLSERSFRAYEALGVAQRQYLQGDALDPFSKVLKPLVNGMTSVIDATCPDSQIYLFNKAESVKLGVWKKFSPRTNGKNGAEVLQTVRAFQLIVDGRHNLLTERRNSIGLVKGFTVS